MIRQRKPIPRLSEKRSKSGKPFLKRSAIKRKHRKPSEFKRIYGSKARVLFVKSLPCCACIRSVGDSDNAHIENGGIGYKAGFKTIVPLCRVHHNLLHQEGRQWFESAYNILLSTEASRVQKLWELQDQEHLG